MRLRLPVFLLFLAALLPAQQQCILTGEPRLIRAEGLAEPLGSIQLQCAGGAPAQVVSGAIQLTVDSPLGNRLDGVVVPDVVLAIWDGANWAPLPSPARLAGNSIWFESLQFSFDARGALGLRISGLRAQGRPEVRAFVSFLATPALPIPTPVVLIGKSETSLLSGFVNPSFTRLTLRVTENVASAFGGPGAEGIRLLVRFQNVPGEATVLVPDAIAGSNAATPTSAGDMSLPASSGAWQSGSSTLLLIRMDGADSRGAGGTPAFTPQSGLNALSGGGPSGRDDLGPYAVYQVWSADPASAEFAELPASLMFPAGWHGRLGVVRASVQLAPLSAAPGPSSTLPIPRFLASSAPADCERLGDCRAAYFPRVVAFLNAETKPAFEMPAGAISRSQYIAVRNDFGGLAEWEVEPRYKSGKDWIRLSDSRGINNATVVWQYDTRQLAPGKYEGELAVRITNGPAGLPNEQTIPLTLTVTPAAPVPDPPKPDPPKPVVPVPFITDIVNAADGIPGPVAPGSLVRIRGDLFALDAVAMFDGLAAVTVSNAPQELIVEAPLDLTPNRYTGVAVQQGGVSSGFWGIDVLSVAPAIFGALNSDGAANSSVAPAPTGSRLEVRLTGLRLAAEWSVRIHDRLIADAQRVDLDPLLAGVDALTFLIPEDLPAMSTAITVCGRAKTETAPRCAEPFEVFLSKP